MGSLNIFGNVYKVKNIMRLILGSNRLSHCLASHIGVVFRFGCFNFDPICSWENSGKCMGKQWMMPKVLGSIHPCVSPRKLLAPEFGLVQLQSLQSFGERTSKKNFSLTFLFSVTDFQMSKSFKKYS